MAKADTSELEGIPIENGKMLTHQLFTDDIGLFLMASEQNFKCAREVIAKYEKISGASLNVSKSIVVPIFLNGPILEWLQNTRCKITTKKEVVTYLCCPIGYVLTSMQETNFLLGKVRKQL